MTARDLFVGLMSGTSLDGVDAALVEFASPRPALLNTAYLRPFPRRSRPNCMRCSPPPGGPNELDRAARAGNGLARVYAEAVSTLLK